MRAAEILEVLPTRGDHGVVGLTGCRGDRDRPPIARFRLVQTPALLRNDGQVVQRIGQVGMDRSEFGFLAKGGVSEKLFRGNEIADARSVLRLGKYLSSVPRFRHRIPWAPRRSDSRNGRILDYRVALVDARG